MALRTLVLGIGDAGLQALYQLEAFNLKNLKLVAINTAHPLKIPEKSVVESLTISGGAFGSGGSPELAAKIARESQSDIEALLYPEPARVYLLAGFGGGTGTGMVPVIASMLHEIGIAVYAIVSMPYIFEGPMRMQIAERGLSELTNGNINDAIVVRANTVATRMLSNYPDIRDAMTLLSQSLVWHLLAHLTG